MIKLTGNKKDGFTLTLISKDDKFKADMQWKYEELLQMQKLLNKKFK